MMNEYLLHKEYIKEKGLFKPKFYNVYFTPNEISFIMKWFHWVEGLIKGHIPPLNENQRHFVGVFNRRIKPHFDPPNKKNKYYNLLTKEQKTFVRYFYILKHKEGIKKYILYSSEDSIYQFVKPKHTLVYEKKQIRPTTSVKETKKVSKTSIENLGSGSVTCISCGKKYPKERYDIGYKICISCSSVNPMRIVDKGFQTREGHIQMNKGKYRND